MDEVLAYKTATELYNKELDRLFQRFHFFLIGSSFLIVALVTIVSRSPCSRDYHGLLFNMVVWAGLLLSGFFFGISLRMSRYLGRMLHYLYKLEKGELTSPMFPYRASRQLDIYINKGEKVRCVAEHTWAVPLGFIAFWVIALCCL
jgi:hypothetical protein